MSNLSPSPRYRIGYALSPKKEQSFITSSLITHANQQCVDLIRIDPAKPLTQQGPFDCIVHKLYKPDWTHQLHQLSLNHPNIVVVDPPEAIERLHNRVSMLEVVTQLRNETFWVPNQRVVYDPEILRATDAIRELGLRLPLIAKQVSADGGARSHEMCLVLNLNGLSKLETPIVVQEFVNHGGVVFKVYVVGDHVKCVKRRSLPDVPEEKLNDNTTEGLLSFSQISNSARNEEEEDDWCSGSGAEKAETPPFELVVELARGLREAMGLRLFNFDLIRDSRDKNGRYLVIDINYFPGYAKMPSYESVLVDFFKHVVDERRNKTSGLEEEHQEVRGGG
jgi:inositol-1,3,4-trisphosphate 5/6-kinase/inositol-tetrakisphosphate 1-kinase